MGGGGRGIEKEGCPHIPPPRTPVTPIEYVPSTLLRARSAAELLQHFPLAKIVLFNEHAETAFRPRFIFADSADHTGSCLQIVTTDTAAAVPFTGPQALIAAMVTLLTGPLHLPVV